MTGFFFKDLEGYCLSLYPLPCVRLCAFPSFARCLDLAGTSQFWGVRRHVQRNRCARRQMSRFLGTCDDLYFHTYRTTIFTVCRI